MSFYNFTTQSEGVKARPHPMVMAIGAPNSPTAISFMEEYQDRPNEKAIFEPSYDMTPLESARINVLVSTALAYAMANSASPIKPLTYIRNYGLERHFRFSQQA